MTTNVMANYSYGEDCFKEIPSVLATYRIQSIAFVGGKRALDSSEAEVRSILEEQILKSQEALSMERIQHNLTLTS